MYQIVAPNNRNAHDLAIVNPRWTNQLDYNTFVAQIRGGPRALNPRSFLRLGGNGTPNLVSSNPDNVTLRLSANGNMAIEDADLKRRQPKVFYATQEIIDESNDRLELMGSYFRLRGDRLNQVNAQRINVGGNTLLRVLPDNVNNNTSGLQMSADQACNAIIQEVLGGGNLTQKFENPPNMEPHPFFEYHVAKATLPHPQPPNLVDINNHQQLAGSFRNIAIPYAQNLQGAALNFINALIEYGINQFTSPEVGECFQTISLLVIPNGVIPLQGFMPVGDSRTQEDYFQLDTIGHPIVGPPGGPQFVLGSLTWGNHWGGVVAKDDNDVITLENYARNSEDEIGKPCRRYYFQMYSTDPPNNGQGSWHHTWTSIPMRIIPHQEMVAINARVRPPFTQATYRPQVNGVRGFANPITMRFTVPDSHYDGVADRLYVHRNLDDLKNRYNEIVNANDADTELQLVLIGLHYANVHIQKQSKGRQQRVYGWINALTQAFYNARFRQNLQAIEYTLAQMQRVRNEQW